jgi:transcriptional regulator
MARLNNKEEKQKANREAHKRRTNVSLERNTESRTAEHILIVCEGQNTEISYFEELKSFFKITNATIKVIAGNEKTPNIKARGTDLLKILEKAKEMRDLAENDKNPYTQVWCVFDHDPKVGDQSRTINFDIAIKNANKEDIKVAYSNQAFEFWLLLHFENCSENSLHRKSYYDKINSYLTDFKLNYDRDSKLITKEIFEVLQSYDKREGKTRQKLAIDRAKRILKVWENINPVRLNLAQEESSTTVFELVEELIKYKS